MRRSALFVLVPGLLMVVAAGGGRARAQSAAETLHLPSHPHRVQPVRPPEAAPRTPVQTVGPAWHDKGPVVARPGMTASVAGAPVVAAPSGSPVRQAPTPSTRASDHPSSEDGDRAAAAGESKEKYPLFVSLRSDEVNMRVGPGMRYRIKWIYKRRYLPVEIKRAFDVWRWVVDPDGIKGWVHIATLTRRRSFIVQPADATLRARPSDTSSAVAILKVGVIGRIESCKPDAAWCHVVAGSYDGYLRRSQFWGTLPGEAINP